MTDDSEALYAIDNTELSMAGVLVKIRDGLTEMQAGVSGSGFQGGIVMLLRVPGEWVELIEAAAACNGVRLERIEPDGEEGEER